MKQFLLILMLLSFTKKGFGHASGESSILIGPDQGVLEASKDKGFKLSPEATKRLEVKAIKPTIINGGYSVPIASLVRTLKKSYIFRFRDGFIKGIDITNIQCNHSTVTFKSKELLASDEVILKGNGYLRIVDLGMGSVEEEEEDSHDYGAHKDESSHNDEKIDNGEHKEHDHDEHKEEEHND